jgi:hypothetical protein
MRIELGSGEGAKPSGHVFSPQLLLVVLPERANATPVAPHAFESFTSRIQPFPDCSL